MNEKLLLLKTAFCITTYYLKNQKPVPKIRPVSQFAPQGVSSFELCDQVLPVNHRILQHYSIVTTKHDDPYYFKVNNGVLTVYGDQNKKAVKNKNFTQILRSKCGGYILIFPICAVFSRNSSGSVFMIPFSLLWIT
jgi:hypothetical protein